MKVADIMGGLILLAFAGYIFVNSLALGYASGGIPGAGFLPLWISVILAVAASAILIKAWRQPLSGPLMANRATLLRTLFFGLWIVGAVLALPHIGMVVTLVIFMLLTVTFLGVRNPFSIAATVILVPLFVYTLFQLILNVPLPEGPWGF